MDIKKGYQSVFGAFILLWTFGVTVCRAIRLPNDFAETYWLLDYRFGPMKRGLIGSLCTLFSLLFDVPVTPRLIVCLAAGSFSGMCLGFLYVFLRMLRAEEGRSDAWALSLVVASSPFMVMSGHLFGYLDSVMYLLAILSVALVLKERPIPAAILSSLGILVHELYLVIGLPLGFLATIHVLTSKAKGEIRWTPYLVGLFIPLLVLVGLVVLQGLMVDAATLREQLTGRLYSFGFVESRYQGVADWQTASFWEFFRNERGRFLERLCAPAILGALAPTVVTMVVITHAVHRIRPFSPFSIVLLAVIFVPLVIHAIAWDTARISAYVVGSGFLAAWILAERGRAQSTNEVYLLLALPALILNALVTIPLMDGEVDRFSMPVRLLLYLPAIASLGTAAIRNVRGDPFREFRRGE